MSVELIAILSVAASVQIAICTWLRHEIQNLRRAQTELINAFHCYQLQAMEKFVHKSDRVLPSK